MEHSTVSDRMLAQFTKEIAPDEGPDREWLTYSEMLDKDNYTVLASI
jgi:hypothetical protein